jgi:hypothetical protein
MSGLSPTPPTIRDNGTVLSVADILQLIPLHLTTTSVDQEIQPNATIKLTYIPCVANTTEKKAVAVLDSIEIVNRPFVAIIE